MKMGVREELNQKSVISSSRRKPLKDVSNGGFKLSKKNKKNNNKSKLEQECQNEGKMQDPIDLLLFSHSNLSSLLRQIDELVAQAVKAKADDKRNKDIRSFANVLSEIHSSLKLSVLRLEEALTDCRSEPEIQIGETSLEVPTVADKGDEHGADTPETMKHDLLVSPSPLVSWRASDCLIERGKQLFLLTPLPRPRTTISKTHASSKITPFEGITLSNAFLDPSFCAQPGESNHNIFEPVARTIECASGLGFASPIKIPAVDQSAVLMIPCLEVPPNSCALLEPGCIGKNDKLLMSTPYPVGNDKLCESKDSASSSGEVSEKLGLKYPELMGIKQFSMLGKGGKGKALEASPAWIMSPPKCCTLLEPLDQKAAKEVKELAGNFNQLIRLAPQEETRVQKDNQNQENKRHCNQGNLRSGFSTVEITPLLKDLGSTINRGMKPGENTLKKELWTRFEAASTGDARPNVCAFEGTFKKGFLDMLEEVSCEEANPHPGLLDENKNTS